MLLNATDGNNPGKQQQKCGLNGYKKSEIKKKLISLLYNKP